MKIEIISDVVCPWCAVGYKQLEQAIKQTGIEVELNWQPFQLNPNMVTEGENLREHLIAKYGISIEDSVAARIRLQNVGEELNFGFNFNDKSRIYNTFDCHRLLHLAAEFGLQHQLKLRLFEEYFSNQKDISDHQTLLAAAEHVGLNKELCEQVLESDKFADDVTQKANAWTAQGISSVPSIIINNKYLLTGAQGVENYVAALKQIQQEIVES